MKKDNKIWWIILVVVLIVLFQGKNEGFNFFGATLKSPFGYNEYPLTGNFLFAFSNGIGLGVVEFPQSLKAGVYEQYEGIEPLLLLSIPPPLNTPDFEFNLNAHCNSNSDCNIYNQGGLTYKCVDEWRLFDGKPDTVYDICVTTGINADLNRLKHQSSCSGFINNILIYADTKRHEWSDYCYNVANVYGGADMHEMCGAIKNNVWLYVSEYNNYLFYETGMILDSSEQTRAFLTCSKNDDFLVVSLDLNSLKQAINNGIEKDNLNDFIPSMMDNYYYIYGTTGADICNSNSDCKDSSRPSCINHFCVGSCQESCTSWTTCTNEKQIRTCTDSTCNKKTESRTCGKGWIPGVSNGVVIIGGIFLLFMLILLKR